MRSLDPVGGLNSGIRPLVTTITARLRRIGASRPVLLAGPGFFLVAIATFPGVLRGEVIAPVDILNIAPPWSVVGAPHDRPTNPLRSDIVDSYIPAMSVFGERIRDGDIPLWSDSVKQGVPFFQFIGNGLLHPLSWIWAILPAEDAITYTILFKLTLLGLAMYALLRNAGASPLASFIGGVIYQFQGFNVVWLFWPQTLVAGAAPLLFAALLYHWRNPSPRSVALLAGATFLLLAGGFPSVAGYALYFGAAWGIALVLRDLALRRPIRRLAITATGAGAGVGLGVALIAIQILPTLEYFSNLGVIEARGAAGYFSLPDRALVLSLLPFYYGNSSFYNYAGPANYVEAASYVGWLGAVLALIGIAVGLRRRQLSAVVLALGALACAGIVYGLDPGFVRDVVARLPVFRENPNSRLLSMFAVAVAALSGLGADAVLSYRGGRAWRIRWVVGAAALVALALTGYQLAWFSQHRDVIDRARDSFPELPVTLLTRAWFAAITPVWALAAAALLAAWKSAPRRGAIASALIVAALLEGTLFAARQNPTSPSAGFYPETPGIKFLQEHLGPGERVLAFDGALFPIHAVHAGGIPSTVGHTYYAPPHKALLRALLGDNVFATLTATVPRSARAHFPRDGMRVLGARYYVFPPGLEAIARRAGEVVYGGPDLLVVAAPDFAPAWLATRVQHVATIDEAVAALAAPAMNARRTVVIVGEGEDTRGAAGGQVTNVSYEPERQVFAVSSEDGGVLVVPGVNYPGWEAAIDGGDPVPVETVDAVYRGVRVGPGQHTVEMRFHSSKFTLGALMSGVALAVLTGLLLGALVRVRLRR